MLFDLPRTVESPVAEVDAFAERCEITGGDFFDAVPAGADAYLLSHVVHDWPEPEARVDPRPCPRGDRARGQAARSSRWSMPADDTPHPAHMLDITMMLLTGGEERTEDEYAELLARAGFRLERVIPTRRR